jgi:P4 family phage/plasmid primase-like protien
MTDCPDSHISTSSPADPLHPDDRADLHRSGLSDSMIEAMGCFSVDASETEKLTGVHVASPGYAIPYLGIRDQTGSPYVRIRLRTPSRDIRYVSGRGDDPQVYVPPGFAQLPVGNLLVITEGEKKSAKAVQEGISCVGLQGVWSAFDPGIRAAEKSRGYPASEETPPITELLEIARRYKTVLVLGDSDLLTNTQARAGLETLAKSLAHRDVRAVVAYCPPAFEDHPSGERKAKKQGLDDWLVADSFRAIRSLPALAFAGEVARDGISDTFNARMIARQFEEELAFSRGVWHHWNRSIWEIDNVGHRRRLASKLAGSYRSYAEKLGELVRRVTLPFGRKDGDWPDELRTWSAPIQAAVKIANTAAAKIENLRCMEAAFTIAQGLLELKDDVWDRDPNLLGAQNGVVDLSTGELLPAFPKHYITRVAGVAYDPAAACPTFDRFLSQVHPDEKMRLFLQTLVGYGATGHAREQKIYIFVGAGANGKGTFTSLVMEALGNYAAKANAGMLAEQRPDGPRNDVAALAGARLVSMSETSAHFRLDEVNLKTITGEDPISARFLHKEFFKFLPVFTPILDTNHVPGLRETGTAMRRRVKIVPWDITIPEDQRDQNLRGDLLAELPGILAWIVRGATRYLQSGLREPQRVIEESRSVMASCDPVGRWLAECTVADQQACSSSTALYENYGRWASREGEAPVSIKGFGRVLEERGFPDAKRSLKYRRGIRIRDDRESNADMPGEDLPAAAMPVEWSSEPDHIPADDHKPVLMPTLGGGYIA